MTTTEVKTTYLAEVKGADSEWRLSPIEADTPHLMAKMLYECGFLEWRMIRKVKKTTTDFTLIYESNDLGAFPFPRPNPARGGTTDGASIPSGDRQRTPLDPA